MVVEGWIGWNIVDGVIGTDWRLRAARSATPQFVIPRPSSPSSSPRSALSESRPDRHTEILRRRSARSSVVLRPTRPLDGAAVQGEGAEPGWLAVAAHALR